MINLLIALHLWSNFSLLPLHRYVPVMSQEVSMPQCGAIVFLRDMMYTPLSAAWNKKTSDTLNLQPIEVQKFSRRVVNQEKGPEKCFSCRFSWIKM